MVGDTEAEETSTRSAGMVVREEEPGPVLGVVRVGRQHNPPGLAMTEAQPQIRTQTMKTEVAVVEPEPLDKTVATFRRVVTTVGTGALGLTIPPGQLPPQQVTLATTQEAGVVGTAQTEAGQPEPGEPAEEATEARVQAVRLERTEPAEEAVALR